MSHARSLAATLLVLGATALLAGCGGGGGGGGSSSPPASTQPTRSTGAIAGKVVDTNGEPVASGVLLLDGVQQFNAPQTGGTSYASGGETFPQGGYQLAGVPAGAVHVVKVQTTVGGVTYTGSTQVVVPSLGGLVSNGNIVVSPVSQQATVSGYVRTPSGGGVGGAQVYFQSPLTTSALTTPTATGSVSLVAVTFADGHFEADNVPVQVGSATRTYNITASDTNGSGATAYANTTLTGVTFTAGQVVPANSGPVFTLSLTSSGGGSLTPTATLLQSFTQPDIPAFYAQPHAVAGTAGTVYDQIRASLSPAYAKMKASGRLAAVVKRLAAAQPRAAASANTVEMDLFFSLPGDQTNTTDPQRSRLSGFEVYNNSSGTFRPYDFLQDPLANFYDDPDVGATATYVPNTVYQFAIQSIALDGSTVLGQSSTLSVAPLAFLNLTQPVDPNDTSGTVQTLPAGDTITWGGIQAVQSYTVYLYGSFPGVSTTPLGTATLSGTTTSYTPPSGLVSGQEYWVVVAATASDNGANASAISVSQIVPFYAH